MKKEYAKSLLDSYSDKDLARFSTLKKSLPKEVHVHDPKELTKKEIKAGKVVKHVDISKLNPEFIYDKKNDMLYHRVSEGCYKHVA